MEERKACKAPPLPDRLLTGNGGGGGVDVVFFFGLTTDKAAYALEMTPTPRLVQETFLAQWAVQKERYKIEVCLVGG